ncbi:MAG TPA: ATP-binding cassette domain-containing protein, partial [Bacillota bacterium]|nr:ATP-binding cassette domain-containing protein [Bacillota bacterium]
EENIMAILEARGADAKTQRHRTEELIEEFKLGVVRKTKGIRLSGGERRRTEIARALATDPSFILLDEPFAGVDPIAVADIQEIIAMLREKNLGVLITDHNVRETLTITDRAYIMHEGHILVEGSSKEIANDLDARRLYLGERFSL